MDFHLGADVDADRRLDVASVTGFPRQKTSPDERG
jgi:hypothetical protein